MINNTYKKYINKRWNQLTYTEQQDILNTIIDCVDHNGNSVKLGECIIDFESGLSISGNLVPAGDYPEIVINKDAKFYNPSI